MCGTGVAPLELDCENVEPDAWFVEGPAPGATWLSGIRTGTGALGSLLCDTFTLAAGAGAAAGADAGAGAGLGAALGGGLGGGLLGALDS